MERAFRDHFCPPPGGFRIEWLAGVTSTAGWFTFHGTLLHGRLTGAAPAVRPDGDAVPEVGHLARSGDGCVRLPFDLDEVVTGLRHEHYVPSLAADRGPSWRRWARRPYYAVRPLLPVGVRRHLQRRYLGDWRSIPFPRWPVDTTVDDLLTTVLGLVLDATGEPLPITWFWPGGAEGCILVTHDVETATGRDRCLELAALDSSFDVRSSFQFVPEVRYDVPQPLLEELRALGCDVNVHGLCHDGRLFDDRATFEARLPRIRAHAERFGAAGFRSPVLYRRAEWLDELGFSYDLTIPNVAHLDPQRGGCCTVLPWWIGDTVELPLTTTQDYTVLHVLAEPTLALWRDQVERIAAASGLATFNVHPDYLDGAEAVGLYRELLAFLADTAATRGLWQPSPDDAARWWRRRHRARPVRRGAGWGTETDDPDAVVALAHRSGGGVRMLLDQRTLGSSSQA